VRSKFPPFYGSDRPGAPGPDEEEGATRQISRPALLPEAVGVTYRLGRRLGQGGFAEIYEAEEVYGAGPEKATRKVALKRLLPSMRLDPMRRRHLQREAHLAAQLNHPNIVRVLGLVALPGPGLGPDDLGDEPALVMELVEGIAAHQLLHRLAARSRRLTLPAVVHIIEGLLRALSYLADPPFLSKGPRPLVHADISLENLMVTTAGEIKLVDFGIAGLDTSVPIDDDEGVTSIHQVAGKRPYTPPSPSIGGGPRASAASDLYAAGVCLWELLTGLRFPVLPRGASSREMGSLIALSADGLPKGAWAALKLCLMPQAAASREAVKQALDLLRTLPATDGQEQALGRLVRSLLGQGGMPGPGPEDDEQASEPYDPVAGLLTRLRSAFCARRVLAYQPVPPEEIDEMGGHEFILREGLGGGPPGKGEIGDAPLREALDRGFLEEDGALFFRVQVPGAGPHVVVIQPGPGCVYDAMAQAVLRALLC
jgi:serine/threonine protein kinase